VELETQATRIAEFQPGMISGLLQTSEYAREFLHLACGPVSYGQDEDEIDQMVEGALRALVVSAPTLVGQLDRLLARHWTADPRARHHPV